MENQCLGLAEALRLEPVVKRISLHSPWRQLSPWLRLGKRFAIDPNGDEIGPPWPDLLIASGRLSVLPALSVRERSRKRTFTIQIQDPVIGRRHFDLVVVPDHDRLRGANVVVTRGALHRVTAAKLAEATARLGHLYNHLPRPRIAVLIGGDNGIYRMTPTIMGDLAERLNHLARAHGAGLMITPSRRTGADNEAILRARMRDVPSVVWNGEGENPYFAFLGLAEAIVVTCDSVSMVSEACSTGKPVYLVPLEGGSPKFRLFHDRLGRDGIVRPFNGSLQSWNYPPLDDTNNVAVEVARRLAERGPAR
ncbi:MAG: mitochondrial fission ELM1 family protein [Rhodospirillaceae bacterium]